MSEATGVAKLAALIQRLQQLYATYDDLPVEVRNVAGDNDYVQSVCADC